MRVGQGEVAARGCHGSSGRALAVVHNPKWWTIAMPLVRRFSFLSFWELSCAGKTLSLSLSLSLSYECWPCLLVTLVREVAPQDL